MSALEAVRSILVGGKAASSSVTQGPQAWKGKRLSLLDMPLYLRDSAEKNNSLLLFLGEHEVERRLKTFEGGRTRLSVPLW